MRSVWWRGKERGLKEPEERGRVTWSVWWRDEERGLEEPAEHERVARSVQWRGKERVVARSRATIERACGA